MSQTIIQTIARVRAPYPEKFGIPRQPGLVPALSQLHFVPPFNQAEAFVGLELSSHIWVVFLFDGHKQSAKTQSQKLSVRPPRLGGNKKMGVFATRASFRPNQLGQSVVKLLGVHHDDKLGTYIEVEGLDCLDGTQVIDIKPYVPYADCLPEASTELFDAPEKRLSVEWPVDENHGVNQVLAAYCAQAGVDAFDLRQQITALISYDPRPSYQADNAEARQYGVSFHGVNIVFTVTGRIACIDAIERLANSFERQAPLNNKAN